MNHDLIRIFIAGVVVYSLIALFAPKNIEAQGSGCRCFQVVCSLGSAVLVRRVTPEYPREALINKTEGWVDLKLLVNSKGNVLEVTVVNSEPPDMFDDEAVFAATLWRFESRDDVDDYIVTPRICFDLE